MSGLAPAGIGKLHVLLSAVLIIKVTITPCFCGGLMLVSRLLHALSAKEGSSRNAKRLWRIR